ncbi:MAG: carboxypeptidase-like regulatory domain-containing protein [Bacteroidales bacterium]
MKRQLLLCILLSFTLLTWSQKGSIKGRIFNEKTNQPLEFANIIIQGTLIGSTSDLDGNFTFTGVEPGFMRLQVSYIGYQTTVTSEIQVQGNQTAFINIAVPESDFTLDEIVIRPDLFLKKIESPISTLEIGVQEIEKTAGANRDVSKVVQTLPGVGATDPNRNDLIVRGGGPSENVFYLDGVEIPIINHFATQGSSGGAVGIINPDFVREINFYTGAFPANLGYALSSVMDIRQKDGSSDRVHTKLSVGASDAALTIDGPLGKNSSFIVSARQSYLQFLFDFIGLPFLPTYNDFQVKYKTRINQKNELTFIGIGAIDDMVLNTDLENPDEGQRYLLSFLPTYEQWNYAVGLVWKHYADTHYDTWVLSRNMLRNKNYKYPNNDQNQPKLSDYESDEAENKIRFERTYPSGPVKIMFGAGLNYAHYTNATLRRIYANNQVNTINYNTDLNLFSYRAFLQLSDSYLNEDLRVSLGINLMGNTFNQNMSNPLNQISPRLSGSYSLNTKWNINANIGRYSMQPSYTTLGYRETSNGPLINQNESLTHVYSNHFITGLEFKPSNNSRITLEGFLKTYDHYPMSVAEGISMASKGTDYGQIGDEAIQSTGKGRAYGLEWLVKIVDWRKSNLSMTYTLFRSEFTDAQDTYRPSSWDTRHLLNLIGSYNIAKSWNIAARWRFVGGQPYTPIDEELSSRKEAWDIRSQPYLDYSQYNGLRLPNATQLDIRIDKEFYFEKWLLNAYVDVQNAYNFKSENAPMYTNTDENGTTQTDPNDSDRYILRSVRSVGGTVLPTIGIIIKF